MRESVHLRQPGYRHERSDGRRRISMMRALAIAIVLISSFMSVPVFAEHPPRPFERGVVMLSSEAGVSVVDPSRPDTHLFAILESSCPVACLVEFGEAIITSRGEFLLPAGRSVEIFAPPLEDLYHTRPERIALPFFAMTPIERAGHRILVIGTHGEVLDLDLDTGTFTTLPFQLPGITYPFRPSADLASDQCTLFYTSASDEVLRFDVCRGQPLSPWQLPSGSVAGQVRALAHGGVIVAAGASIMRLDSAGTVRQTWDHEGVDDWAAVALDASSQSFWAMGGQYSSVAFRFDLASGAVLQTIEAHQRLIFYGGLWPRLSVYGEPRAALHAAAGVPTLSGIGAAIAIAALAFVAMRRL